MPPHDPDDPSRPPRPTPPVNEGVGSPISREDAEPGDTGTGDSDTGDTGQRAPQPASQTDNPGDRKATADTTSQTAHRPASQPKPEAASKPQSSMLATLASELREISVLTRKAFAERFFVNIKTFLAERQLLIWSLALAIGILVAYASIIFRALIGAIQYPWLFTTSEYLVSAAENAPWWNILLVPALGGLFVGYILDRYMPGRRAHGVADVIEARALHNARIDPKTGLMSAGLSVVSLGCGASVGREGPIVHLGATIAAVLEDRFNLTSGARRTLLGCGVAAGVSASFNAPIAGVLFAHEVILMHYGFRALVPTVIASTIGAVIARIHFGPNPAFAIPDYQITSYWEFPAFALLGVTCALVAILFEMSLMATERLSWRLKVPLMVRTSMGGLIVGAIALAFPQVLGVGYEATDQALSQALPLGLLLALIVAKTVATAVSLSCRFAGGIFSPSLFLGAMTGSAFGLIATSVFPEIGSSQGLYAILGMGAVAGAVLGAPLSTTMIVFELTSGYSVTIALLLTVSIAVGLTQAVLGHSIFHWQLGSRGLFLTDGPHQTIMRRLKVADFMRSRTEDDPESLPPPLDGEAQPWLLEADNLDRALKLFAETGRSRLPVVDATDETRLIGWADRISALSTFNRALIDANVEHHR